MAVKKGRNLVTESITLQLPDRLYQRLTNTAQAIQRPLEEVIVRALEVGAPPDWDDVPAEFQADLAALDRPDDAALWQIARSHKTVDEMTRYDELLERNQDGGLTDAQRLELMNQRKEADRFMLRKAQAAAILRWRGHQIPLL
jgi:predicted transcriptional regulator